MKAWDYAQTIFQIEKLRIAHIKAEIDTRKHICLCFEDDCMVVHTLFMLSMYHDYVSWLCILAMYNGYVFGARMSSRRGFLGKVFDKLRIQGRMQILK